MRFKPHSFIEISLRAGIPGKKSKKDMTAFFAACGIPTEEIVFFESSEDFRAAVYTREKKFVKKIRSQLGLSFRGVTFQIHSRILNRKDWLDKWQADYRMMPLGRKFMLVPFWQKKEFRPGKDNRLPLYLDPKAAFGSGQHPSTQIMISLMERVKKAGPLDSCLDLGTGTGILSVAAHRLGAQTICTYDMDSVALQAARFNLKLNGARNFSVRRSNVTRLLRQNRYSWVLANLTPAILTKAKRFIFSSVRPGGFLMVSGILSREIDGFSRSFTHPHFRCLRILKKGGWGGLLLYFCPSFR